MDGTLLDENGQIPSEFDELMAELKKRGVLFAPASGRQYHSLVHSFAQYENDFIFLAENGTLVRYRGETLHADIMEHETVLSIFAAVPQDNIYKVFCGLNDAYILSSQDRPEFSGELGKYYTRATAVDDFAKADDRPIKVSLFDPTGHADEVIYPLVKDFADKLQVVVSSPQWVDLMSKEASKGAAVQVVQQRLHILPEECAAFGDYLNDAEMMTAVYHSFAMANAQPEIKKLARYQTESNAEHGVIKGIKRLMEQGFC